MDPASAAPLIVQVAGPLVLPNLFHWGLFGVLSVQVYFYYMAFPKDPWATKCLVYTVYTLLVVETVLLTNDAFKRFGYGFADFEALLANDLGWFEIPVMSGLIALVGQSFYAYRIHVLSKSWWIPLLIVAMSLTSTVGAILTGVFTFQGVILPPRIYRFT
ncbi:hypothetical protein DFH08DRAFT_950064 [Mycena albidolilacea]|uniref:Uncharacterized protein n=1 Tax=Mycena albidolilacea TaxID=1033008 RepID=A0AAD7APK8_9AGAR|nr:hypothetical protein DFH08DRAFT_950064 [Mycena albidolilacea]